MNSNFSNITGATGNTFDIASDQTYVDKYIRLTAISIDSRSGTTALTSASSQVTNVEDEATGTLAVSGTFAEGQTLTADTSGITDVDDDDSVLTFTYQWQSSSSSNSNFSNITGATGNTFDIASDQTYVDKYIRLTAISIDSRNGTTAFISASSQVTNVEDEATGTLAVSGTFAERQTLTADTSDIQTLMDQ